MGGSKNNVFRRNHIGKNFNENTMTGVYVASER
jgi:hypothetical protein